MKSYRNRSYACLLISGMKSGLMDKLLKLKVFASASIALSTLAESLRAVAGGCCLFLGGIEAGGAFATLLLLELAPRW